MSWVISHQRYGVVLVFSWHVRFGTMLDNLKSILMFNSSKPFYEPPTELKKSNLCSSDEIKCADASSNIEFKIFLQFPGVSRCYKTSNE